MGDFGAERSGQDDFFPEWQSGLPALTDTDRLSLDQIRQRFRYQREMGKVAEGSGRYGQSDRCLKIIPPLQNLLINQ
jgi:hypothetical protein